jgi:hypothetical protein
MPIEFTLPTIMCILVLLLPVLLLWHRPDTSRTLSARFHLSLLFGRVIGAEAFQGPQAGYKSSSTSQSVSIVV